MTELHEAVVDKNIRQVRRLLKGGADVNAPDEDGATPLHYAAAEANTRIISLLLEAGADGSRVDNSGETAMSWASRAPRFWKAYSLLSGFDVCQVRELPPPEPGVLEQAISAGDLDLLATLIGEGTGETSADEFTSSPIVQAVVAGRAEVIEFFVKQGADVNREEEDRWMLLHVASDCGQLDIVRTLLNLGARINVVGFDSADRLTPLQIACRHGHAAIAERS